MDRFETMRAFAEVAESGSFAAAARRLGLARSVVTKRVAQLEQQLGVRLLNRTTRAVTLTETGAAYLPHCLRILADLVETEQVVGQGLGVPAGRLRLCCSTSFGVLRLGPVVCAFQESYQDLRVELLLNDRFVNPIEEGFDLAIHDQPVPLGSLQAVRLAPNRRLLCAAPAYLERRGIPNHPRELRAHDCIHYSFLPSGTRWRFTDARGRDLMVEIAPRFSTNNGRVMLDAAISGRGIVKLPTFLIEDELLRGELVPLLRDFPLPAFEVTALYPPAIRPAAKVRLLIDHLRRWLDRGDPPWDRRLREAGLLAS